MSFVTYRLLSIPCKIASSYLNTCSNNKNDASDVIVKLRTVNIFFLDVLQHDVTSKTCVII